jgi:iron complex transport system substrate-binding protein
MKLWPLLVLTFALPGLALAQEPPRRIASINMCTDQMLIDFADPAQIMGLSPFSRNRARAFHAEAATRHRLLSGTAEELMVDRPDLVVSSRFTRRSTHEFLRAQGVRVEEFDVANTIADVRAQMLRMGQLTGQMARAEANVAELDARLARLMANVQASGLRILPLQRRGWVPGGKSLMGELISLAGADNAATSQGGGGFMSLEAIVALRPDALLLTRDEALAEDQGRALLLHPAIAALFPPERRIILPDRFIVCGGSMLADAVEMLDRQIRGITPRANP